MIEALLVVFVAALLAAVVLLTATLAGAALQMLAAFFFAPVESPPSLIRLSSLVERQVAEWRAAVIAGLDTEPPLPDALVVLRSVRAPLGLPPSLPRIAAMMERQAAAMEVRRPE